MLKFAFCLGPFTLFLENGESTIAIVSGYRDCCIAVPYCDCKCCIRSFPDSRFEIAIVYSDFQRVQNFFYRNVPGSVKIAIIVLRFPLGVNYFSTSPVLCSDLPPSLDCNYDISIVASRLLLWCPYCVSDYCKMVFPFWPLANVFAALQLLYRDHECCIVVSSQFTCCDRVCCIAIVVSFPIYRDRICRIAMVIVISW